MFYHRIWFSSSLYYLFLIPFSWLYGLMNTINRISYQIGWRKIYRFSVPVVIIGNLTIGGTGKTPMVIWLAKKLKSRGWKVGIVSRGYKGKSNNYPIVLNNNSNSDECGDEPILIQRRTGALVAVSPKRSDAVSVLLCIQPLLDIVISDDGLQHYALFRDIEWVMINGIFRFGNGHYFPAGPMRERSIRLKKVHAIIVSGLLSEKIKIQSGEILMQLFPSMLINILTGEHKPLNFLNKVIAIAGIGHPFQFFITLRKNGIIPIKEISFSDHQIYSEKMLVSLINNKDEALLMTEKDAVKCLRFAHKNWWYVRLDVKINERDEISLLSKIEKKIKYYKINNVNKISKFI